VKQSELVIAGRWLSEETKEKDRFAAPPMADKPFHAG